MSIDTTKSAVLANKLRAAADAMQKDIDHKRRPLSQNWTPKRGRELSQRLWEADNLERTQRAMRALASGGGAGTLPEVLRELKTKAAVAQLVHKGLLGGGGYYDVLPDPEYRDKTPAGRALQALIEGARTGDDEVREKADTARRMEDELRRLDIPGFFPTPPELCAAIRELANLDKPFLRVLEPSAGKGDLAEAMWANKHGRPTHAVVHVCEIAPRLRDVLAAKGHEIVGEDFLAMTPADRLYDRVVSNPPFERGADIAHVQHAWKFLQPGGRLVSIVSEGPFFRQDGAAVAFRDWLEVVGSRVVRCEEGAFAKAFNATGVACRIVTIDKPAACDTGPGRRAS